MCLSKNLFLVATGVFLVVGVGSADEPMEYYDPADGLQGYALHQALHDIIDDHYAIPLSSSSFDTHDAFNELDEDPDNPNNVILIYSGWSVPKSTWPDYNREHTWPKSLGTDDGDALSDLFAIYPCDASVNTSRGNKYYDDCEYDCDTHDEAPGNFHNDVSWEPRNEDKGNLARAMFYMAIRYEGDVSDEPDLVLTSDPTSSGCDCMGEFEALLAWHQLDPVDNRERQRNEGIFEIQGNRNPFVDHPGWVEAIWGEEEEEYIYVLAAANAPGVSDTEWRTDLDIRARGEQAASVRIDLLPRDTVNLYPAGLEYEVPVGNLLRLHNVLETSFGFRGAAALRIAILEGEVGVFSRTYNLTPDGTYGQAIPGVHESQAIQFGEEVELLGLASDDASRTNVGFVNTTATEMVVQAMLFGSDGSGLGTVAATLKPLGHSQINDVFRVIGAGVVPGAYAIVSGETPGAPFLCYASVVDNRTGDPTAVIPQG